MTAIVRNCDEGLVKLNVKLLALAMGLAIASWIYGFEVFTQGSASVEMTGVMVGITIFALHKSLRLQSRVNALKLVICERIAVDELHLVSEDECVIVVNGAKFHFTRGASYIAEKWEFDFGNMTFTEGEIMYELSKLG